MGEVYFHPIQTQMVATDASIYSVKPVAVIYPACHEDVIAALAFARHHRLSVHARGAGSGLCGSAIGTGIILDFSRFMNRLLNLDMEGQRFTCEPGYRFGELEKELAARGLFFPPDPSSGEYATFGGMMGTNASGAHSVKYGNVADYVVDAKFALADGSSYRLSELAALEESSLLEPFRELFQLYQENRLQIHSAYPPIRYNVAGYNLRDMVVDNRLHLHRLLTGSEGTLAIITEITFALRPKPLYDSLVVAYYQDIASSARAVQEMMPLQPAGIEIMDKSLLELARQSDPLLAEKIPAGVDNVLLIEFDSFHAEEAAEAAKKAQQLCNALESFVAIEKEEKEKFWAVRKAAVPILYKLKGEKKILALIEDAAVPVAQLVSYFAGTYALLQRHNVSFVVYGHIAKGLMHTRPLLNLKNQQDVFLLKVIADEFFELVYSLGGVVSGEHGDGRIRSAYIEKQYKNIYHLFQRVKKILDPDHTLNPEIKSGQDQDLIWHNLRYGTEYHSEVWSQPALLWPEGLDLAIETCHGCSKCTTVTTATRMCPIYKFTRKEEASPKAKANLLRALISGQIDSQELYRKTLQNVMDHCVNCGSCYQECPSNVNIPKMALEARSLYRRRFGTPLAYRFLTGAELAGRNTRKFSFLLAFFMKSSLIRKAAEKISTVSVYREFPLMPASSLQDRIMKKGATQKRLHQKKVLYFAGCYASYIRPEIGEAALRLLNYLQVEVITPEQHCCGLPMLSKGMSREANEKIHQNQMQWQGLLSEVDAVVVTCSSCGLSLTREWQYLEDSPFTRAVQEKSIHISHFINNLGNAALATLRKPIEQKLAYHMPCHLKVQPHSGSSLRMLTSIGGLQVDNLDSHCCGMAGSWGMSRDNYELSRNIGSDLAKKISASEASVAITDCPTCRMQIEHLSDKPVRHPVEILAELSQ